jgi:hypothetical protein
MSHEDEDDGGGDGPLLMTPFGGINERVKVAVW